jgi:CheY-like chemotaxis protein
VYLPIPAEILKDSAQPLQPKSSEFIGSETILIAEDNQGVRTIAQTILERSGYTVLAAANAAEALNRAQRYPGTIDLLLTDVVMPEMNGKDLLNRIREICPQIKVLFMSGYTDNVVSQYGILEKGVNYIQKPFSNNALAQKLRSVLDNPDAAVPSAPVPE